MQGGIEAEESVCFDYPPAQGLSRRAHDFSVEALLGNRYKRIKAEKSKNEKVSDRRLDTSTKTVVGEEEYSVYISEECLEAKKNPFEDKTDLDTQIRMELQGSDLWSRFYEIGTEMIITKAGRRMFPSIRVKVRNLDPLKQYYIAMDIRLVDSKRYRYVYHSSQWMVAGNSDQWKVNTRLFMHPDSPCSGQMWMRQLISFDCVKLTNNEMDDKGHIILQSMHKYKPRIHVIEHGLSTDVSQISVLPTEGVCTFTFPETQFTTVTAYQNQQITKLKIDRNPFAKGFRDPGRNRGVLDSVLDPWQNPFGLSFKPFHLELQGENCEFSASCDDISSLKRSLPDSSSLPSYPFHLCDPDSYLKNHSVLFFSQMTSSKSSFVSQPYYSFIPDRLRSFSGLQPFMEYPMQSPLHRKKMEDAGASASIATAFFAPRTTRRPRLWRAANRAQMSIHASDVATCWI